MLTTLTSSPAASLALEQVVGEVTARAALAVARALHEFRRDGLSARKTRMHAGAQIARLFELWQVCAGQIDIYAVARARGTHLLQERHGEDLNTRMLAVLIDAVLESLQQVVRSELN
jgi:hypothetical protein